MKKIQWSAIITLSLLIIIFFSCQKEFSLEGLDYTEPNTLQKALDGTCLPINIGGTYFAGKATGDTNFIEVSVLVKTPGPYTISTPIINGYSFSGEGAFSDTGLVKVQLKANGNPVTAGIDNFTVSLGSTPASCVVSVHVQSPPIGAATYTLEGDPSACVSTNIEGVFMKNINLDTTNKIEITVNVTATGSYSISTTEVNGYSFSSSGFFTTTGRQAVILKGTGKPLMDGVDEFTITGSASSCTFPITVTADFVTVSNNDYFPLTYKSSWTYSDIWNTGFTIQRDVSDSVMTNGKLYKVVSEQNLPEGDNQHFYRKAGSFYYEYVSIDQYTHSVKFSPVVKRELLFLKENSIVGTAWESAGDTGTIIGGQPIVVKYTFRCTAANVGETIQGKSYQNVLVIEVRPQVRSLMDAWGDTGEIIYLYYAKGVGLIYTKTIANSFIKSHWELNNYSIK